MRSVGPPAFRTLRVFVCHASEDKPAVAKLCDALTEEGVDCWFDIRSLMPGDNWERQIEKSIRRSDAVLVCLSERSKTKRSFLQTEIRLVLEAAAAQARPASFVFPVLIERCTIPPRFKQWQAVDATSADGVRHLLQAFRQLASDQPGIAVPADHEATHDWEMPRTEGKLVDIAKSTRGYEAWLKKFTPVVASDFDVKHRRMLLGEFPFFRSTFYRWAEAWPRECAHLASAPLVLSAGEVNIQAFGTWLDPEGRLAWGITSFDEAYPLPYTSDLSRLITSIAIAAKTFGTKMKGGLQRLSDEILESYRTTMEMGGDPFVLGAAHQWLLKVMAGRAKNPLQFWSNLDHLPSAIAVPAEVCEALERSLPVNTMFRVRTRVAGSGSLGRPRYVGIAQWRGGPLAAEARYIPVPAAAWAAGHHRDVRTYHNRVLETAHRAPNLRAGVWKGVFVRRIGPDITNGVGTEPVENHKQLIRFSKACAIEIGNVHAGTPGAQMQVLEHLNRLPGGWLAEAAQIMMNRNQEDFQIWCRVGPALSSRS